MSKHQELGKCRRVRETSWTTPEDKWCVRKSVGSSPERMFQFTHHPAVLDRGREQRLPFSTYPQHCTGRGQALVTVTLESEVAHLTVADSPEKGLIIHNGGCLSFSSYCGVSEHNIPARTQTEGLPSLLVHIARERGISCSLAPPLGHMCKAPV